MLILLGIVIKHTYTLIFEMLKIDNYFQQEMSHKNLKQKKKKPKDSSQKHIHSIKPYIKERQKSKKDIKCFNSSLYQLKGSKSNSHYINQSIVSKNVGNVYSQLNNLKNQYQELRQSYNTILKDKNQLTNRQNTQKVQFSILKRDMEKQKSKNNFLIKQIQRLKKESQKIIEIQQFKNKKLEETLQEKELMIQYLRSQLGDKPLFFKNTAPAFNHHSVPEANENKKCNLLNHEKSSIFQEDSLSFSQDKSKIYDSIMSDHDQTVLTFTKKDVIILENEADNKENKLGQENLPTFENRCSIVSSECVMPQRFAQKIKKKRKYMKMKTSVHETERLDNESIGKGKNKKKKSAKKKFT